MKAVGTATLIALAALACQQDQQREGPTGLTSLIRDSAGIQIVENPAPPAGSRLGWRVGSEPSVSIGSGDAEGPYVLYLARDATILADGRIVVADGASGELRFFDSTGSHLASRGGQGEGPGEFDGLVGVAPWAGDSILAWFAGPRLGISVFDSDGNYGRMFEINGGSQSGWFEPASTSVRGSVLAVRHWEYLDTLVMHLRDGEGGLRATLGPHPSWDTHLMDEGARGEVMYWKTFGRDPVWGLWGDLAIIGLTSRYEIKAYGADGALARIVRREHSPRVPTPEDVEAYIESEVLPDYPDATPSEQEDRRRRYRSLPVAEHFPAFSSIMVDALDHLWIREYDLPREQRPAPLWTVFDPEGHVLGLVETPAELLRIHEIGEDYILGTAWDELGVETKQVWRLERMGG